MKDRVFYMGYKVDCDELLVGCSGDTRREVKMKLRQTLCFSWKNLKKKGYRVVRLRMEDIR